MSEPTQADLERALGMIVWGSVDRTANNIARALVAERTAGFAAGLRRAAEHIRDPRHRARYILHGTRVLMAVAEEIESLAVEPEQEKG